MKERMLPVVALATLCLVGCERTDRNERTDRTDRTDVDDVDERGPASAGNHAERSSNAATREREEVTERRTEANPPAPEPGREAQGSQTRSEFVAASRRRLEQLERELGQLETRSRERGKQIRSEIREEKRRLDGELDRIDAESDEAWSQMKSGFADALERLETQIRQVRKDIDPDA
jgi:DNA repair exonuclease SbcCD ATPase subunit